MKGGALFLREPCKWVWRGERRPEVTGWCGQNTLSKPGWEDTEFQWIQNPEAWIEVRQTWEPASPQGPRERFWHCLLLEVFKNWI